MAPYITAINTFSEELIEAKMSFKRDNFGPSERPTFETLFNLPSAKKLIHALLPDSNHTVLSGHIFDLQMVISEFLNILRVKSNSLVGFSNYAFCVVVYGSLMARAQCCDIEVARTPVECVLDRNAIPERLNFSKGIPKDKWGWTYFLNPYSGWDEPSISLRFNRLLNLCQIKYSTLQNLGTKRTEESLISP